MEINAAAVSLALSARGVAVFPSVTLLAHPSHSVMPALVHRPSVPEMHCAADNKRIFLTYKSSSRRILLTSKGFAGLINVSSFIQF